MLPSIIQNGPVVSEETSFKEKSTTTDGRWTPSDGKSSHDLLGLVIYELKGVMFSLFQLLQTFSMVGWVQENVLIRSHTLCAFHKQGTCPVDSIILCFIVSHFILCLKGQFLWHLNFAFFYSLSYGMDLCHFFKGLKDKMS